MKIDIQSIDREQFMVHEHFVNGELLYLVQPQHIGCKWQQNNKHFRSSVWNAQGELVSAGFPKFVNWGENPDNFPVPQSLKDTDIVEKIDGSLLVVSKYKGNHILRTRGTVDASKLDNGHELELFKQTILPKLQPGSDDGTGTDTWELSYLFEWVSPNQRIILNYGDSPDWFLVGTVRHEDYSLLTQGELNAFASFIGFKRPPIYTFPTVEDLMQNIESWKGKEGVVIYSNYGQILHKVKGLWYLALHRMKEALASFDKVVDVYFEQDEPTYQQFEEFITNQFDYELWTQIRGDVSRICDGMKDVQQIINGMTAFVNNTLKPLPTRKDQAVKTIDSYGITNRASFVFKLLDGKMLTYEDRKKLLYQVLKK
jgi:hypothetical protein